VPGKEERERHTHINIERDRPRGEWYKKAETVRIECREVKPTCGKLRD
jgi:hypothetical protein